MILKVIRYKNYGCTMEREEDDTPYNNKFYWCFFELNNGEIIDLQLVENLKNKKIRDISYDFSYAKEELKTGQIHEYKFGNAKPNTREFSNEFFDWFDNLSPIKNLKDNREWPTKEEEKCVKEFFDKHILKTKQVATNTVNLSK